MGHFTDFNGTIYFIISISYTEFIPYVYFIFCYFGEGAWARYEPGQTYRYIVNAVKNMQEEITETKDMDRYSGQQLSQIEMTTKSRINCSILESR